MKIESLLNYIGHKSKIQEQIFQHLPKTLTGTFYDCFAGSAVIGLNAPYTQINCVELNPFLSQLYIDIQDPKFLTILEKLLTSYQLTNSSRIPRADYLKDPNIGTVQWMGETISNLHLDQLNKAGYEQLLKDFNNKKFSGVEQSAAFMTATIYGRNSSVDTNIQTLQLKGGVGPLDFSLKAAKKLKDHQQVLAQNRHQFTAGSYQTIKPTKDDFCYFDPPYLATGFKYSGWTEQDERDLLAYIDQLPCDWALSNTLQSGSKKNEILIDWAKDKIVIPINKKYRKWAGARQETNKKKSKINQEVLILSRDFALFEFK